MWKSTTQEYGHPTTINNEHTVRETEWTSNNTTVAIYSRMRDNVDIQQHDNTHYRYSYIRRCTSNNSHT